MDFHDQLDVFLNENKIGTLFTDNGVMSFAYDTEFLNTPGAYPLSKNLPLKEGVFPDPEVEGFFSNLLPDERIRNTVAMILVYAWQTSGVALLSACSKKSVRTVPERSLFIRKAKHRSRQPPPFTGNFQQKKPIKYLTTSVNAPWMWAMKVSAFPELVRRKNWWRVCKTVRFLCRFTGHRQLTSSSRLSRIFKAVFTMNISV